MEGFEKLFGQFLVKNILDEIRRTLPNGKYEYFKCAFNDERVLNLKTHTLQNLLFIDSTKIGDIFSLRAEVYRALKIGDLTYDQRQFLHSWLKAFENAAPLYAIQDIFDPKNGKDICRVCQQLGKTHPGHVFYVLDQSQLSRTLRIQDEANTEAMRRAERERAESNVTFGHLRFRRPYFGGESHQVRAINRSLTRRILNVLSSTEILTISSALSAGGLLLSPLIFQGSSLLVARNCFFIAFLVSFVSVLCRIADRKR